jgi:hypothetical protein
MRWTKTTPSEAGFYWLRNYRIEGDSGVKGTPVVVHLHSSFDALPFDVTFTGNDSTFGIGEVAEGEWAGPLEPPE